MPSRNQHTGARGEDLAAAFLEKKGYVILERNYRFMRAEVDLIAFLPTADYTRGGDLVFVEVKWRRSSQFGSPEAAVDATKKRNLMTAAEAYLHERKMEGTPCRFDVIAIRGDAVSPRIEHFEHAFVG
jgi:putative endonuclease